MRAVRLQVTSGVRTFVVLEKCVIEVLSGTCWVCLKPYMIQRGLAAQRDTMKYKRRYEAQAQNSGRCLRDELSRTFWACVQP